MRKATIQDASAIAEMLRASHARSKYLGRATISEPVMQQTIAALIAAQGQIGPQGSCLFVVERNGKIVAFIAGVLDRIYFFLSKLRATDIFLINQGGMASDTVRLVDAYTDWARSIRAVDEITLSWSDAIPGAARISKLYARKGFEQSGAIYELKGEMA